MLKDLSVQQGSPSVVAVETLLDRLDQLESGQGRPKSEHKSDLAAFALLAKRGYPSEERARVRKLASRKKRKKKDEGTGSGTGGAPPGGSAPA